MPEIVTTEDVLDGAPRLAGRRMSILRIVDLARAESARGPKEILYFVRAIVKYSVVENTPSKLLYSMPDTRQHRNGRCPWRAGDGFNDV